MSMRRSSLACGHPVFWLIGIPAIGRRFFWSIWKAPIGAAEGTDVWATEHGYAAVTPLRAGELDSKTYDAWRTRITPQ